MSAGTAGSVLRMTRQVMGATQAQAAERLGVSRSYLGRIERSDRYDTGVVELARGYGAWLGERYNEAEQA
jgi:transcriptional regulator with XRE-family HTH domain